MAAERDAYRSAFEAKEEPEELGGLGDALVALGGAAGAETAYQRAAKIDPGSVTAIKLGALRAKRKHAALEVTNVGRIGVLGGAEKSADLVRLTDEGEDAHAPLAV